MSKRKLQRDRESCPNCSAIWAPGSEEWDWQQCDACGWPNCDDEDLDLDSGDDSEYIDDDPDSEAEDNNPNDSRNL